MNHSNDLKWLSFLSMISDLSAEFVTTPYADVDPVIEHALAQTGTWFRADRSYLFLYTDEHTTLVNTHEWCAQGVAPQKARLQRVDASLYDAWVGAFDRGEYVHISDVSALAASSPEREMLEEQDIRSLLMLPLVTDSGVLGIMGYDLVRRRKSWTEGEIAATRLISGNICGLLQRQKAETQAVRLSRFDPLTGLFNRAHLQEQVRINLLNGNRSDETVAFLLIDIDHFKQFNDRNGFELGDRLLLYLAERLKRHARKNIIFARLGDDEFAVFWNGVGGDRAQASAAVAEFCDRLRKLFGKPVWIGKKTYEIRISVGVSLHYAQPDLAETLYKEAGIAMQRAKQSGRNTTRFFAGSMQRIADDSADFGLEMSRGLQNGEFVLHFQPIVNAQGRPVAAEALVRWQHPERGLLGPGEFIPFAEEEDLIVPLGREVFRQACAELTRWQTDPVLAPLQLSVNVSMKQFQDPNFVSFLESLWVGHAECIKQLKLEMTESLLALNIEEVIAKMTHLTGQGFKFSLDDFGTGYSSLAYIKSLPLAQLKIDKAFVHDLADSLSGVAIAQSIVALGQSLNLDVVAEGVETRVQFGQLAELGCTNFQGYLFAHPVPAAEFAALVSSLNDAPYNGPDRH